MLHPLHRTDVHCEHAADELRRFLVGRLIFCPLSGEILDVDKSVFILDADGDACMVVSQTAWGRIVKSGLPLTAIFPNATQEWHVDESTVR